MFLYTGHSLHLNHTGFVVKKFKMVGSNPGQVMMWCPWERHSAPNLLVKTISSHWIRLCVFPFPHGDDSNK